MLALLENSKAGIVIQPVLFLLFKIKTIMLLTQSRQ